MTFVRTMEQSISVIIPACNEEQYLGKTLESIKRAAAFLQKRSASSVDVTVVDNASCDRTAEIARALGAKVLCEPTRNISRVRNTGAIASTGNILVFVDADVLVPETLLWRVGQEMDSLEQVGGAVDAAHRPRNVLVRFYLQFWRILGSLLGMAQGATQVCRRDVFVELGGYDESYFMGEDVDFFWRMRQFARRQGRSCFFIKDLQVIPSPRRFDQWPLWRTLVWTNPLFLLLFRRRKKAWEGWYEAPPR